MKKTKMLKFLIVASILAIPLVSASTYVPDIHWMSITGHYWYATCDEHLEWTSINTGALLTADTFGWDTNGDVLDLIDYECSLPSCTISTNWDNYANFYFNDNSVVNGKTYEAIVDLEAENVGSSYVDNYYYYYAGGYHYAFLDRGYISVSSGNKVYANTKAKEEKGNPRELQLEIGSNQEKLIKHPHGIDIIPPTRTTPEFAKYKEKRLKTLRTLAKEKPNEIFSAQVTFDKPLMLKEFDELLNKYPVDIISVEGTKGSVVVGMRYNIYKAKGKKIDRITNAIVKGKSKELLRIQKNNKVLLVDINENKNIRHLRVG